MAIRPILLCLLGLSLASTIPIKESINDKLNDVTFLTSLSYLPSEFNKRILHSPFSHQMSTAMVNDAAGGDLSWLLTKMSFEGIPKEEVSAWFKDKIAALTKADSPISTASAIYVENTLPIYDEYLANLRTNYQAKVEKADFRNHLEEERQRMIKFFNESTEGHLHTLLPKMQLDWRSDSILAEVVIGNAIFMNVTLEADLNLRDANMTFHKKYLNPLPLWVEALNGPRSGLPNPLPLWVEALTGIHSGLLYQDEHISFVEIPFKQQGFAFFMIVPSWNTNLRELKVHFRRHMWNNSFSTFRRSAKKIPSLCVTFPKINLSPLSDFNGHIAHSGHVDAPKDARDFRGMTPADNLAIKPSFHFLKPENGRTSSYSAQSGTAGESSHLPRGCGDSHGSFIADRPFIYGISHEGTPIFVGQYD
uniref:SERPIN domain-containing protein n=1 Tax=Steinernema glaseri TaxID=37863 RepID=A0A1I7ZHP4_9BILA